MPACGALPDFIVIGAAKAGSTSLYHYLRSHPEIFVPSRKELGFFVEELRGNHDLPWYRRQFRHQHSVTTVGEISPEYTLYPRYAGVPRRIAQLLPDAKLVYIVRDPIARLRSHYWQRVLGGVEHLALSAALEAYPQYIHTSRYAFQLEQYLDFFPPDRIFVFCSEDLYLRRQPALRDLYDFLGVTPSWWSEELEDEQNVTAGKQAVRPSLKALSRQRTLARLFALLPDPAKRAFRRVSYTKPPPRDLAVLPPDVHNALREQFRTDAEQLRTFMPPDFNGWGLLES